MAPLAESGPSSQQPEWRISSTQMDPVNEGISYAMLNGAMRRNDVGELMDVVTVKQDRKNLELDVFHRSLYGRQARSAPTTT